MDRCAGYIARQQHHTYSYPSYTDSNTCQSDSYTINNGNYSSYQFSTASCTNSSAGHAARQDNSAGSYPSYTDSHKRYPDSCLNSTKQLRRLLKRNRQPSSYIHGYTSYNDSDNSHNGSYQWATMMAAAATMTAAPDTMTGMQPSDNASNASYSESTPSSHEC